MGGRIFASDTLLPHCRRAWRCEKIVVSSVLYEERGGAAGMLFMSPAHQPAPAFSGGANAPPLTADVRLQKEAPARCFTVHLHSATCPR